MKHKVPCDFRDLTPRHVVVIMALVVLFGGPLALVNQFLFGPSERVSSWLSARLTLGPDGLTALTMIVFCLTLALAMTLGHRFLRRFL